MVFQNIERARAADGYDRLYAPRQSWVTGDLDIHDLQICADGRVVFVSTQFSCVAELSSTHSFRPLWTPKFITQLAPEDRCHLNGLAMRDGAPAFATAIAVSDEREGWRHNREQGGVLLEYTSGEVAARGLSMPHSPRVLGDDLWLANAGTGEVGYVDVDSGAFTPVAFCPGFLRGLSFISREYAIVTMSLPRANRTFDGLPINTRLSDAGAKPRCCLAVIDLSAGAIAHWLYIDGLVRELFDAEILYNTRRTAAIGFKSDEIQRVISIDRQNS